ncbi:MAG: nucleoside-diphosphate kinase [Verrucomicrobia bacterium]|nr:nucleoside-diphosphate kinase [Verrucomicrobiota bacterium]
MEMTLVLLKPDCHEKQLVGEVIGRFERSGLRICACKTFRFTPELLRIHYAHVVHLPVYPQLAAYMQSAPVIALALQGDQCVARVREMVGPTDSRKAPKGTIRGDLGEDGMQNVVHASDSVANAQIELRRFFQGDDLVVDRMAFAPANRP